MRCVAHVLGVCLLALVGCRTTRYPDDRVNDVLRRHGEVGVVGFFADADVEAMVGAVREVTDEVIMGVWPPYDSVQSFRRFETDALPVDSAEVFTGVEAGGRTFHRHIFYLSKRGGRWRVMGSRDYPVLDG